MPEFDFSKLLSPENFSAIAEVMRIFQELKPIVTSRLVGWLNKSPTSLKTICDSLTDERARELSAMLRIRLKSKSD